VLVSSGYWYNCLGREWISPIQEFVYKFGKEYKTQMICHSRSYRVSDGTSTWDVEEGLHTFVYREDAECYHPEGVEVLHWDIR
jgi:hypothetical protein